MHSEPVKNVLDQERHTLETHRAALRRSELPAPKSSPSGTFLHGFLLPFSLMAMTLRDPDLRKPYAKLVLIRGAVVLAVTFFALATGRLSTRTKEPQSGMVVEHHHDKDSDAAVPFRVDVPGVHVDIDEATNKSEVTVFGTKVPVEEDTGEPAPAPPAPSSQKSLLPPRIGTAVKAGWGWVLAVIAFMSATEGVIVFVSRRWDDLLSFHASRLAGIRPEDATPKKPAFALDLKWLYRKFRRRIRGCIVFFAGFPALSPLRLLPVVGPWLFSGAAIMWGWYWLGVFAASKSAHAWADEANAIPPIPIRELQRRTARGFVWWPLRIYGRMWSWVTRSINPAVTTFERSPKPFLGLALARTLLAFPGLYLLARPIVPVAAGRLCAEADPGDRFSRFTARAAHEPR